jgi:radical SAM superfamily enzyme YgiQ (UPF0313 family)
MVIFTFFQPARGRQVFRRIHRAGISVLGAFIFGRDGDTTKKLYCRTNYMIKSPLDVMQTTYLTPLPGTRLFDQLQGEGRLLYTNFPQDWDHYDMTEVIHQPQGMPPETLAKLMQQSNKWMYAWPVLARKAVRTFLETRNPMATMFAWKSNINYRNVALGGQPPG